MNETLVARGSNLIRRGAVYYCLITIPTDLQAAMRGAKQKWVSLRTTDYAEARSRKAATLDQWSATFADMRRRQSLTEDDVQTAVWDHYTNAIAADDARRAALPTQADIDAALDAATIGQKPHPAGDGIFDPINSMTEVAILMGKASWDASRKAARLGRLRGDLAAGDTRLIEPEADAFLKKHDKRIAKGDPSYRDLCIKLIRAEIDFLNRYSERDQGNFAGRPVDPVVAPPAVRTEASLGGAPADTIMGLFAKYERLNPNDIRPESLKQARRDVQHFSDFVGPRILSSKITRALVGQWHDLLVDYPVKASETAIFKGMSPQKIVAANKALSVPKRAIVRQTVRRYMGSLSAFCDWLVTREVLASNPVTGMMPKKADPTHARETFSDEALKSLFSAPLFNLAKSAQWRDLDKAGDVAVRDHRFWIPWVMLYSGARPAEIAQLYVDDVLSLNDVWVMQISDEGGSDKRTKTAGSRRMVPIHSALIAKGFLKHVDRQRAVGAAQVFPEVEIPKEGQIAAQFSREFNRYLTKVGVKTGRGIVLYSLRHTFVDRARQAGFMDDEIAIVVGHETGVSKKTMTSRYGVEQHGTLERREAIIEAVQYSWVAPSSPDR